MIVVIYGPMASGKTYHAAELLAHFGLRQVFDDWSPRYRPNRQPDDSSLVLTNEPEHIVAKYLPAATRMSIEQAKALLQTSPSVAKIAWPVPAPDDDGYVECERDADGMVGIYLHEDARISYARPAWADGGILLHLMGGTIDEPGYEPSSLALVITPERARSIAQRLLAIAETDG